MRATGPRRAAALVFSAGLAVLLAGCSSTDDSTPDAGTTLDVAAAFYPLQYVAEQVGGDAVSVTSLTKPGAEPHDLELAPQDVVALNDADLTVYLSGFQPALDDAVAEGTEGEVLDVSSSADLTLTDDDGATDPHFWLDPMRLADVADAVAAELADSAPEHADEFEQNAAALRDELVALDREFAAGLNTCDSRLLVTSHAAFGYLADAYDLDQVGLTGLTPEAEPAPSDLAEVTDIVRDNDVQTIFYETLVSPDVAETVASATGASTAVLDPIEGLTDASAGADYLEVMQSNLTSLRDGLPCR
jgi:zinc transport system substrate-binding protein